MERAGIVPFGRFANLVTWRCWQTQTMGSKSIGKGLEGQSWHAIGSSKERRYHASERVTRQPDISFGIQSCHVMIESPSSMIVTALLP
jgi:hypothetical protein